MRFEGENWVPEGKVSTMMIQSTGISLLSCFYDLPCQCEVYLHVQLSFNNGKKNTHGDLVGKFCNGRLWGRWLPWFLLTVAVANEPQAKVSNNKIKG
jgi:hypothetical protein